MGTNSGSNSNKPCGLKASVLIDAGSLLNAGVLRPVFKWMPGAFIRNFTV